MITKEQIVSHVMRMKSVDEDCARKAQEYYAKAFPEWKLNRAVAEAMKSEAMKEAEK